MPRKKKDDKCEDWALKTPGFTWRVSLSIIVFFGWLVFLIIWLFFYAVDFTIYQNIAIVLASILVVMGTLGASWASWGLKYGRKPSKRRK